MLVVFGPGDRKPSQHETLLSELTSLRDQLRSRLAGTESRTTVDAGPTASEIAIKIKTLIAANSVDAAPQRTNRAQVRLEEPVSTRILRKSLASQCLSPESPP